MAVIPLSDKGDIKLYILCIMQKVGYPLEYNNINDLSLYGGIISNMDFIEAFDELERDKLVVKNGEGAYSVSEDGAFLAATLKSDLAGYIHDSSLRAALQYISFNEAGVKKNIRITETDKGYKVTLSLSKKKTEIMSINLLFDTQYQAQKAASAFSDDPELIYARLISLLGGK